MTWLLLLVLLAQPPVVEDDWQRSIREMDRLIKEFHTLAQPAKPAPVSKPPEPKQPSFQNPQHQGLGFLTQKQRSALKGPMQHPYSVQLLPWQPPPAARQLRS